MRQSWKLEKAKQNRHRNMNKQHQTQTSQTTTIKKQNIHVLLFRVLLCLLCLLLTYQGTCGIVGNKQNITNTEK